MGKNRLKKMRNRALAAVTAAATALGLLLGSVFDSPAELLERRAVDLPQSVITEVMDTDADGDTDSGDSLIPGEERKKSLKTRLRQKLLELPWQFRAVTGLPLWLLGWGLTSTLSALWSGLLSPVGGAVLGCAGTAAAAAAAVGLTARAVFPGMPLKRIFSKRTLLTLFLGSALWSVVSAVLELCWSEYGALCRLLEGLVLMCVLLAAAIPALRKERALRQKQTQEDTDEINDEDFRRRAKALADSAVAEAN